MVASGSPLLNWSVFLVPIVSAWGIGVEGLEEVDSAEDLSDGLDIWSDSCCCCWLLFELLYWTRLLLPLLPLLLLVGVVVADADAEADVDVEVEVEVDDRLCSCCCCWSWSCCCC